VIAAVSISGPIERMGRQPGRQHAAAVVTAAKRLTDVLQTTEGLNADL
jgi:transcriptional regulator, iclR family